MLTSGIYKTHKNYEATVKYIDKETEIAYGTVITPDATLPMLWDIVYGFDWIDDTKEYSINMELGKV